MFSRYSRDKYGRLIEGRDFWAFRVGRVVSVANDYHTHYGVWRIKGFSRNGKLRTDGIAVHVGSIRLNLFIRP